MPHGYLQARFLFGVLTVIFAMSMTGSADAQTPSPTFKVLALAEEKSIHRPFVDAAKIWLAKEADTENFSIDYIENTDRIDEAFLSRYQVFLQLDYPPYMWTATAAKAFENYMEQGKVGWIGVSPCGIIGGIRWLSDVAMVFRFSGRDSI